MKVTRHVSTPPFLFALTKQEQSMARAYAVTLGGGLLPADSIAYNVDVQAEAALLLMTQSATKVFKGESTKPSLMKVEGTLHPNATVVSWSDPVISFQDSHLRQESVWSLAEGSRLALIDGWIPGRQARDETWRFGSWLSGLSIYGPNARPLLMD